MGKQNARLIYPDENKVARDHKDIVMIGDDGVPYYHKQMWQLAEKEVGVGVVEWNDRLVPNAHNEFIFPNEGIKDNPDGVGKYFVTEHYIYYIWSNPLDPIEIDDKSIGRAHWYIYRKSNPFAKFELYAQFIKQNFGKTYYSEPPIVHDVWVSTTSNNIYLKVLKLNDWLYGGGHVVYRFDEEFHNEALWDAWSFDYNRFDDDGRGHTLVWKGGYSSWYRLYMSFNPEAQYYESFGDYAITNDGFFGDGLILGGRWISSYTTYYKVFQITENGVINSTDVEFTGFTIFSLSLPSIYMKMQDATKSAKFTKDKGLEYEVVGNTSWFNGYYGVKGQVGDFLYFWYSGWGSTPFYYLKDDLIGVQNWGERVVEKTIISDYTHHHAFEFSFGDAYYEVWWDSYYADDSPSGNVYVRITKEGTEMMLLPELLWEKLPEEDGKIHYGDN